LEGGKVSPDQHREPQELIDFVGGDLSPERSVEIERHLKTCASCRAYVESVRQTFDILAEDTVPEPPPGYWVYFGRAVRERIRPKRRRLLLILAPGLAIVCIAALTLWWGTRVPEEPLDSMELMFAQMSSGELVESVAGSELVEEMILFNTEIDLAALGSYLFEADDIDNLIGGLRDEEKDELVSRLMRLMRKEDTSGLTKDVKWKGC
jgi:hypothetical protein